MRIALPSLCVGQNFQKLEKKHNFDVFHFLSSKQLPESKFFT